MNATEWMKLGHSVRDLSKRIRAIEMQLSKGYASAVAASYCTNNPYVLSRGVEKVINYDAENYDTNSAVTVDPLAWVFEVPEKLDGVYIVIACISSYPTADVRANDDRLEVRIYVNGSMKSRCPTHSMINSSASTYSLHALGVDIFDLDEGDQVQIKGFFEGVAGTTITLNEDCKFNYVSIGRLRY